jgi:hypothetical protein
MNTIKFTIRFNCHPFRLGSWRSVNEVLILNTTRIRHWKNGTDLICIHFRWHAQVEDHCSMCLFEERYFSHMKGGGLISLWLYKENNKLQGWKKCIYPTYSPLSSTHLWLLCSNFFNPSMKNSFGCAANHQFSANVASSMHENLPLWCFSRLGRK